MCCVPALWQLPVLPLRKAKHSVWKEEHRRNVSGPRRKRMRRSKPAGLSPSWVPFYKQVTLQVGPGFRKQLTHPLVYRSPVVAWLHKFNLGMWHRLQIVQQHSLPSYPNSQFLAGYVTIENIVSTLHANLQVANCQRWWYAFHQGQVWVKPQLALNLLSCWRCFQPTIIHLL